MQDTRRLAAIRLKQSSLYNTHSKLACLVHSPAPGTKPWKPFCSTGSGTKFSRRFENGRIRRWPHQFTLHSYQILFADQQGFVRYFINSLIVSVFTTLLTLLVATPGGYVLSRFKFRGVRAVLLVILATQMFPYVVILISLYTLFRQLHMLNTYPALVLAFTTFSLPFSIWMIKGFCDTLPPDLEEAARIDGLSLMGVLARIVLPLIISGVIAVGFLPFSIPGMNCSTQSR